METEHITELKKAYLFQGIPDGECIDLIKCLSPNIKRFSKNETIYYTGDYVLYIGIILRGTAHAYLEHVNGNQTITSVLTPMRVFGEIIAGTGTQQSPVTICAMSEVTAAFIEYKKVYSMCAASCTAHKLFLRNLLRFVGEKYFDMFDRINILREKSLRSRIMVYLYTLSDNGKTKDVTLPFTKTLLADYLLANRSALSKELSRMQHDGLISVKGREIKILK